MLNKCEGLLKTLNHLGGHPKDNKKTNATLVPSTMDSRHMCHLASLFFVNDNGSRNSSTIHTMTLWEECQGVNAPAK